jgi:SAM-dependent methyltransferase
MQNPIDSLAQPLPAPSSLHGTANQGTHKLLFGFTIFASAFLLFQVEPIIAKIILPWFGGVAAVWAVCLLFFQVALLLGYSYAHLLTSKFPPRAQARIHFALLLVSLLALRIAPRAAWRPTGPEHPIVRILLLLCVTVGLPFFLLSTASPLLQAWYFDHRVGAQPYRLYALSNAGSMLALLSYPLVIEPWVSTSHQATAWSVAFACVVFLFGAITLLSGAQGDSANDLSDKSPLVCGAPAPSLRLRLLWLALAACSSALLIAVTNHISQNIASVPFLWLLPLSLYLLSFILCFDSRRWYRRAFFLRLLGVAIGGMAYALAPSFAGLPWKVLILLFCIGFFLCCMFCHGELARLKPAPEHLTSFYLMLSLGGAIGAVFVALIAPLLFSGYYELHVALGFCAILVLVIYYRDPDLRLHRPGSRFSREAAPTQRGGIFNPAWLVLAGLAFAVILSLGISAGQQNAGARIAVRNFYGLLRVLHGADPNVVLLQGNGPQPVHYDPGYLKLMNGTIDHGLQYLAPDLRREPTTYYGANSGVGVTLRAAEKKRLLNVGAIGLGIGTVATYAKLGDRYTFYEINPLVVKLANQQFSFLRDSPATIDIVMGDARMSLERQAPQHFDVLIVDAFTGDSIPVHLLTLQAFQLYFRHLKPDGVLAVHISNQFLDLEPVVAGAAAHLDKEAVMVERADENGRRVYAASWILLGHRNGFLAEPEIEKAGQILPTAGENVQLWTDNYSSLWRILK